MTKQHDQLEAIFARERLRLTQPRLQILNALQRAETPLSASRLAAICPSIDRASVYRTLELFVKLRIAAVIPFGWKQRYELTGPFKAHHHHLHCDKCNAVIDVHSAKIEQLIADISSQYAFAPTSHYFEIKGLCKNCQPQ